MGANSLPKTVTRQRRDCDLNPGPSAPESSTLTTWLPVVNAKHLTTRTIVKRKAEAQAVARWQEDSGY